jgi:Heavy metal binding domain
VKTKTMRSLTYVMPIITVLAVTGSMSFEYHRRNRLLRDLIWVERELTLQERRLNDHATGSHILYTCPRHPEVKSDKPGACPKCGMSLIMFMTLIPLDLSLQKIDEV